MERELKVLKSATSDGAPPYTENVLQVTEILAAPPSKQRETAFYEQEKDAATTNDASLRQ